MNLAVDLADDIEVITTFRGDALEVFLEKQEEFMEHVNAFGDIEEFAIECLESLADLGLAVYSMDEQDETFPQLADDDKASGYVAEALARRQIEHDAVKSPLYAAVSKEGHTFVVSLRDPETSTVVRAG